MSLDIVPVLQLKSWPYEIQKQREKWARRKKFWPSQDVIDKVLQHYCQHVPKSGKKILIHFQKEGQHGMRLLQKLNWSWHMHDVCTSDLSTV